MATPKRLSSTPGRTGYSYTDALNLGCRRMGLGRASVWRIIRRLSQLLVITGMFFMYVQGDLAAELAFTGMLIGYLGPEGVEVVLAKWGADELRLSFADGGQDETDTEDQETKPDGEHLPEHRR